MKRTIACLLLLAACASEPPQPVKPTGPDQATPDGTVEAWFAAAAKPDREAMLSLFSPEGRKEEEGFERGWTNALMTRGFTLKSREKISASVDGESANATFRAVFVQEGKEHRDGLRFMLGRKDGKWWIVKLG